MRPDASGVLRWGKETVPFFLEWERRAVRPVTMAARLAPYLRYYANRRPLDDHGQAPVVLVVFDDELAATHILQVARREMERAGVEVPLWVSHEAVLGQAGPLGSAWQRPDHGEETDGHWSRHVFNTANLPQSIPSISTGSMT